MMDFSHEPVMLSEAIEALNIKPDGLYIDVTVGGGGHSFEIAKRLSTKGKLICIDRDEEACNAARGRLADYSDRVTIVRDNFTNICEILNELNIEKADGILLDLGVSSHQIDDPDRGFSYMKDALLDMRMDQRGQIKAADIVNTYDEDELKAILRDFGEERYAGKIAKAICKRRKEKPITTTGELAELVCENVKNVSGGHPAKRTFQALRIAVNDELDSLGDALNEMIDVLQNGGRLAVITFHSLEDRIVKNVFKTAENPCVCPPDLPICVCGKTSKGKVVGRKPTVPSEGELKENSRARSAKLRIFEKGQEYGTR